MSNSAVSTWLQQMLSIYYLFLPTEKRMLDMYDSTKQKVKSLCFSFRFTIFQWICASPAWIVSGKNWDEAVTDNVFVSKLHSEAARQRVLIEISLSWDSTSWSEKELCCSVNQVMTLRLILDAAWGALKKQDCLQDNGVATATATPLPVKEFNKDFRALRIYVPGQAHLRWQCLQRKGKAM